MKVWAKYLIIGWSVVSAAIIIVSFQIMKSEYIEEDYQVMMVYKVPEKEKVEGSAGHWEAVAENLFYTKTDPLNLLDYISPVLTKKEFVEKMKKAKGITIESISKIKDKIIYVYLPIYAFAVWMIPILVFSLIGLLFSRKAESK
jgi:hypothetical protein